MIWRYHYFGNTHIWYTCSLGLLGNVRSFWCASDMPRTYDFRAWDAWATWASGQTFSEFQNNFWDHEVTRKWIWSTPQTKHRQQHKQQRGKETILMISSPSSYPKHLLPCSCTVGQFRAQGASHQRLTQLDLQLSKKHLLIRSTEKPRKRFKLAQQTYICFCDTKFIESLFIFE